MSNHSVGPPNLAEHVNNALRESEFPTPKNGYFASKKPLKYITESSVIYTMWPKSKPSKRLVEADKKLVEFIIAHAKEIFAIGIYMDIHGQDLLHMMKRFDKENKSDGSLPISDAEMETIWPESRYKHRRRLFKDSQHIFRPQCFPRKERFSVIQIKPKVVLPIVQSEQMSRGQFGIVYKVHVHKEFLESNDILRKVRYHELHLLSDEQRTCVVCRHLKSPQSFVICWVQEEKGQHLK